MQPAKKRRCSGDISAPADASHCLEEASVISVLNNMTKEKMLALKVKFPSSSGEALVLLEKMPFPAEVSSLKRSVIEPVMVNDIYHKYNLPAGMDDFNKIKVTVVDPATKKHFEKYSSHPLHLAEETPEAYRSVTLPHLETTKFSLDWVYNILDGKAEQDRVLHRDDQFTLSIDYKWDGKQMEDLYCLAIVSDRQLKSIRDLRQDHLSLLQTIQTTIRRVIAQRYSIPPSQMRCYFHYPPSFYQLHVHVTHMNSATAGSGCERAHLLSTVIHNLKKDSTYYQEATLALPLQSEDPLFTKLEAAGCIPN